MGVKGRFFKNGMYEKLSTTMEKGKLNEAFVEQRNIVLLLSLGIWGQISTKMLQIHLQKSKRKGDSINGAS